MLLHALLKSLVICVYILVDKTLEYAKHSPLYSNKFQRPCSFFKEVINVSLLTDLEKAKGQMS